MAQDVPAQRGAAEESVAQDEPVADEVAQGGFPAPSRSPGPKGASGSGTRCPGKGKLRERCPDELVAHETAGDVLVTHETAVGETVADELADHDAGRV